MTAVHCFQFQDRIVSTIARFNDESRPQCGVFLQFFFGVAYHVTLIRNNNLSCCVHFHRFFFSEKHISLQFLETTKRIYLI